MNKLFIDTNAFEKIGFNFDERNPIISTILKNVQEGEYEYYSLSVIDEEIKSHINNRCESQFNNVKKFKWLKNYISDEQVRENCFKDLKDYEMFKKNISAKPCNVSKINPEDILKKYFKIEYPFEKCNEKRKEFPDAFISAYVNDLVETEKEKIYFVTNDKGLQKSLNDKIIIFEDLETFLSEINNISPKKYKQVEKVIYDNIKMIEDNIFKKMNLIYNDLEDEEIDVNNINIQNIIDIKVIDNEEDTYFISCKCDFLILHGTFSCLDYYNSYMPNDCDFYTVQEYIKIDEIAINDYEFIVKLNLNEETDFELNFLDNYDIYIDYELLNEMQYDNSSFDGETSFSQDGGYR